MEETKRLLFCITKVKTSNGNIRFNIKATFSDSKPKTIELWENAWVINNPRNSSERNAGREKLAKEFHAFLKETLEIFELDKKANDRVDFKMKFGDEYSTWCSVGIGALPEHWDKVKYQLNCPAISVPLNEKEIEFFWDCISNPILI